MTVIELKNNLCCSWQFQLVNKGGIYNTKLEVLPAVSISKLKENVMVTNTKTYNLASSFSY